MSTISNDMQCRFLSKYHPKYVSKKKQESLKNLKNRLKVFEILFAQGKIKSVPMIVEQGDDIVQLMDTAVIYMEGGTELDLKALENSEEKTEVSEREEKQEEEMKEEPEEKTNTTENESEGNRKSQKIYLLTNVFEKYFIVTIEIMYCLY